MSLITGSGNLGGRAGADTFCSTNKPTGLTCTNIHAFLTISATDEIRDMPNLYGFEVNAPIMVYNSSVSGNLLLYRAADNWADLLDGSIPLRIADATGMGTQNYRTGSTSYGSFENTSRTCNRYTSSSSGIAGTYGNSDQVDTSWLLSNTAGCNGSYRILCICQEP